MDNSIAALVQEARRRGYNVIPVNADKKPLVPWKEYQKNRVTEAQAAEWQRIQPPAWAVVTGAVSGVIVLDFDGEAGLQTLSKLGLQPHVRTGSGGAHVYFRHPGWHVPTVNNTKQSLGARYPGLDIRADGGYAVFAGKNNFGEYVWVREMEPDAIELLPLELRELLGLVQPPSCSVAHQTKEIDDRVDAQKVLDIALSRIGSGGRNEAGFWFACQLRDNGFTAPEVQQVMEQFATRVPATNAKGQPEPYTVQEARSSVQQAFSRTPRSPWHAGRGVSAPHHDTHPGQAPCHSWPIIEVSNRELRDVSLEALASLQVGNTPETLFVRSGQMVSVMADEEGRHGIREVSEWYLRGRLTRCANFRRVWRDRAGRRLEVSTNPPLDVVRDILALPPTEWRFPPLECVTEAPVLRPDGSLLVLPGYDSATRIVYAPSTGFRLPPLPEQPTQAEVYAATRIIEEMLEGFPFVDRASRANFYALLLTPMVRRAIDGKVPVAIIDAPAAGTGKSLLAELLSLIHAGTNAAMKPAPAKDEEEWRKTLSAVIANGNALTIFDNLIHRLDSPALALAVTASTWTDRLLGQTKIITLPQRTTWVVTGNNVQLGGDMPRRCYWIRLDAQVYQPWQRTSFRIPDLIAWVRGRRAELLAALLTIARGWFVAGRPDLGHPALGSFQEWAHTIAGILNYAGIPGFLENMADLYSQSDPTDAQWEVFLAEVYLRFLGCDFTVGALVNLLRNNDAFHQMLPDDLIDEDRKGNLFQRKVGNAFRQRLQRRFGPNGIYLVRAGEEKTKKVAKWGVRYTTNPPSFSAPPPPPTGYCSTDGE